MISVSMLAWALTVVIVLSFLLAFAFLIGKLFIFQNVTGLEAVKRASKFSILITLILIAYFVSIITFSGMCLFSKTAKAYSIVFLLYLPVPFFIGNVSTYEKIDFYTNIQILTLVTCGIVGLLIYYLG